jgi:hypothetical protein
MALFKTGQKRTSAPAPDGWEEPQKMPSRTEKVAVASVTPRPYRAAGWRALP